VGDLAAARGALAPAVRLPLGAVAHTWGQL
jgi:hypothetical protein